MKTIKHPAFIEDYSPAHTELLRTMPKGTYAIFPNNTQYMLAISNGEGRVIGLSFSEVNGHVLLQEEFLGGLIWKPTNLTIDKIVGDGQNEHKEVNGIQLVGTLHQCLQKDTVVQKQLLETRQELAFGKNEKVNQHDELTGVVKDIISALKKDATSGKLRFETNQLLFTAIELLEEHSKDKNFNLENFLRVVVKAMEQSEHYASIEYSKEELLAKIKSSTDSGPPQFSGSFDSHLQKVIHSHNYLFKTEPARAEVHVKMKTINHPAFIADYTPAHTELLKTMPVGTHALFQEDNNQFVLVISNGSGKVEGLRFEEIEEQIVFKSSDSSHISFGMSYFSVDQMVALKVGSKESLNQLLLNDTTLQAKLFKIKQEQALGKNEVITKLNDLNGVVKDIIIALENDRDSSKFRSETNDLMEVGIRLLKNHSKDKDFDLEKFLQVLVKKIQKIQNYSVKTEYTEDKFLDKMKNMSDKQPLIFPAVLKNSYLKKSVDVHNYLFKEDKKVMEGMKLGQRN